MKLTRELAFKAIDLYYDGRTITSVLEEMDVSVGEFYRFLRTDPIISEAYARAQFDYTDIMCDKMQDIAESESDANKARVIIDTIKWRLSRMRPSKYGERLDLNVTQTVDITGALEDARNRYPLATPNQVIETTGRDITSEVPEDATGSKPVADPKESAPG